MFKSTINYCVAFLAFICVMNSLLSQELPEKDVNLGADIIKKVEESVDNAEKVIEKIEKKQKAQKEKEIVELKKKTEKKVRTEDLTKPKKPGKIYNDGKLTFASCNTSFKLESADALSHLSYIEYRIDDSPLLKYRREFTIEEEGHHRITYRGVDKVGNIEPQNLLEVIVDCSAPSVSIATNPVYYERDGLIYLPAKSTLELRANDRYSGVQKIQYKIGTGEWVDYTAPVNMEEYADKYSTTRILYRAIDKLGNTTEDKVFAVYLDKLSPEISIKSAQRLISIKSKQYSMRSNFFTIEASDADSGLAAIWVKIDGEQDFQPYSTPLSFDVEGVHSIEAKALDKAGNESDTVKVEFFVDDNPPRTTIQPVNIKTIEKETPANNN